jgi:hypothetical protein
VPKAILPIRPPKILEISGHSGINASSNSRKKRPKGYLAEKTAANWALLLSIMRRQMQIFRVIYLTPESQGKGLFPGFSY